MIKQQGCNTNQIIHATKKIKQYFNRLDVLRSNFAFSSICNKRLFLQPILRVFLNENFNHSIKLHQIFIIKNLKRPEHDAHLRIQQANIQLTALLESIDFVFQVIKTFRILAILQAFLIHPIL